jgi:hypothetical protein
MPVYAKRASSSGAACQPTDSKSALKLFAALISRFI